jgi:type I restriction-modification system DNA methylase subunit
MDKTQAKDTIVETFTKAFDKNQFLFFAKNLLNHLDDSEGRRLRQAGPYIKKAFQDKIKSFERLGTYTDPQSRKLDVLVIYLRQDTTLERGRTSLRNFAADYLATGHGRDKDAVLAAFVSRDVNDWRFSYIKLEYSLEQSQSGRVSEKKELTPAQRYSFLVGSNERSHTAQKQFLPLLENVQSDPTLEEIEQAFDIETVTKEFFERYKDLFESVRDAFNKILRQDRVVREDFKSKGIETDDFAKKLLGQIVFLYFLQKKGWFGVEPGAGWGTGNKQFLRYLFDYRDKLRARQERSANRPVNFFNDVLEHLFYDALARERDDDYYARFDCRIPFLNGGLFEPLFGYDWVNTEILLADDLFANSEKTKEGDEGTGILDVFDRYNFTVNEAEPLEREVAVDPEMLGKVFENLLPENLRHRGGAYYTPRVIVNYMCQQSLINYLSTHLPETPREEIEEFVHIGYAQADFEAAQIKSQRERQLPKSITLNARNVDKLLEEIAVCDPAVGSGAFLVGMMQEIVRAREALSAIEGLAERTPYDLKRHSIQNSLYGVDIDPGGVEIAKLRLWLSLVVDEDDRNAIQALPNLDYKIMQGNSLLGEFDGVQLIDEGLLAQAFLDVESQISELSRQISSRDREASSIGAKEGRRAPRVLKLEKEIKDLRKQRDILYRQADNSSEQSTFQDLYSVARAKLAELKNLHARFFSETSRKEKDALRKRVERVEWEFMEATLEERGEQGALADLSKHRRDNRKNYFLWKLHFLEVFQTKGGFDVVMANPPYVRHEEIKEMKPALQRSYQAYVGTADLYVYFYECALKLLNRRGAMAFITSNKYFRAGYGEKLRQLLAAQTRIRQIIDFGDAPVFEATAYACVVVLQPQVPNTNEVRVWSLPAGVSVKNFERDFNAHSFELSQSELKADGWRLETPKVLRLLEKLRTKGRALGEYVNGRFYYGIKTGLNEAFVVDRKIRDELIAQDESSAEVLKPFLRGRDVKRWRVEPHDLWLIFVPWHFPLHQDPNVSGVSKEAEKQFREKYPAVYQHLLGFKKKLSSRNAAEVGVSYEWYALQRWAADYWEEFEHPKILYPDIYSKQSFAWDEARYFSANTTYFIPTTEKWLTALLNSSTVEWFYSLISNKVRGGYMRAFSDYMRLIPIPSTTSAQQVTLSTLVDYILFLKAETSENDPRDQLMIRYFEQIIDALVFELYLTDEILESGKQFFSPLMQECLPNLDDIKADKLDTLRQMFERLFDRDHIVRQNIFFLDTLESVRIIEGKA